MLRKLLFLFSIICTSLAGADATPKKTAIVIKPVSDVLGPSPYYFPNELKGKKRYQGLPFSYPPGGNFPYARIHQVLLHERVNIIKESGNEIFVECPGANLKSSAKDKLEPIKGWMLKEDVILLSDLKKKKRGSKKIPIFADKKKERMMLLFPHANKSKKTLFSTGTEFVVKRVKKDKVYAYAINGNTQEIDLLIFPKQKCFFHHPRSNKEKIKLFNEVLETWSQQGSHFIPYVLGGSSWTTLYQEDQTPFQKSYTFNGQKFLAHDRKKVIGNPRCGFDCSSLILSAAKMADLPYTLKNTTAMAHSLRPLKKGEAIEEGDFIWYSGHVMIITKIEKGTFYIVQARGYSSLSGRVFRKEGKDIFEGIKTDKDLAASYHSGKSLKIFNFPKSKISEKRYWKILKLRSIFS